MKEKFPTEQQGLRAGRVVSMMMKAAFSVLLYALMFFLLGLVLNLILLYFLGPELSFLFNKGSGPAGGHAGGIIGLVLILFVFVGLFWKPVLIIVTFGLGFPVMYLILGKMIGSRKAIQVGLRGQSWIVEYVLDNVFSALGLDAHHLDTVVKPQLMTSIQTKLKPYLSTLEQVPRKVQKIIRMFLSKISIYNMIIEIVNNEPEVIRVSHLRKCLSEKLTEVGVEKAFSPRYEKIFIVIAVNIALFVVLKIII